jgi:UDP-glucose 4-epimerase|tara:strand:- start:283 stop:1272 length:990 start_codon:yes stop_codon:yes gene_type:complete
MVKNLFLITGGCGFIGINLIRKLKKSNKNIKIRVLDNESGGNIKDLAQVSEIDSNLENTNSDSVTFCKGDIRDLQTCKNVTYGVNSVIHLAANTGVLTSINDPIKDLNSNVIGTLNMLESSRINKIDKFIFSSSGAPLGSAKAPIHELVTPMPVSPYGSSKLAGEAYCSSYFYSYDLKTIVLRFSNVYGPNSYRKTNIIPNFINKALKNVNCEIFGDGNQSRDFLYIDDLLDGILKSINLPEGGHLIHLASGIETSVNEIVSKLNTHLTQYAGINIKFTHIPEKKGEVRRSFSNIDKAKSVLNWKPQTGLDDGIKETIKYFLKFSNENM